MTAAYRQYLSRAAAFGILLGLILAVWVVVIGPLWSAWTDRADQIDRLTALIVRLKSNAAEAPALRAQLANGGRPRQDRNAVFVAANPTLAAADLQSEVKRIAESAGAQIRSIQQLPAVPEEALSRIGVRAEMQSDTAQIGRMLYDLQAHAPTLIVRSLTVRGPEQTAGMQSQPRPLFVQVEVTSFAGPPS